MANRVQRILNSIKTNAGTDVYESVKAAGGETDVKVMIDELEKSCSEEVVAKVMVPCGSQCLPRSFIERARTIYKESEDIEDFLCRLNETRIGGGQLHLEDGKIIGIYDRCYCTLAWKIKGLSPLFCHCSEGWYQRLFSEVFGKPVEVRKLSTILGGAAKCEFEISY